MPSAIVFLRPLGLRLSKSISKGGGRTSYRGLVKVYPGCDNVVSNVRCDALMIDEDSRSDTYPKSDRSHVVL